MVARAVVDFVTLYLETKCRANFTGRHGKQITSDETFKSLLRVLSVTFVTAKQEVYFSTGAVAIEELWICPRNINACFYAVRSYLARARNTVASIFLRHQHGVTENNILVVVTITDTVLVRQIPGPEADIAS